MEKQQKQGIYENVMMKYIASCMVFNLIHLKIVVLTFSPILSTLNYYVLILDLSYQKAFRH